MEVERKETMLRSWESNGGIEAGRSKEGEGSGEIDGGRGVVLKVFRMSYSRKNKT